MCFVGIVHLANGTTSSYNRNFCSRSFPHLVNVPLQTDVAQFWISWNVVAGVSGIKCG